MNAGTPQRYALSQKMLERALKAIPLGTQTFSKSITQYPAGVSPHFITHGKGAHVWDVDGNEYIDYINSLCAVVLGYDDQDVIRAVKEQVEKGVSFSLPTEDEVRLAEELIDLIPCAEMVRFGKNGSDATAGAVRVARAHTGRDRVAVCGYHGWQDWYIGSTARNKGVPQAVRGLTHMFRYNDIESLHQLFREHPGEFAAVIMEPMNVAEPEPGFLAEVAELTRRNGALFILDEIITGFRFHLNGAQTLFGVTPDLASFGKSMANGFAISAVAGKAEYMRQMEEVFFSFTFGGETVSIAAALATIAKMRREPVIDTLWERGEELKTGLAALIAKHGLGDAIELRGKPCWLLLQFNDARGIPLWEVKTLYMQEMLARGILTIGSHNMSYAHSREDIARTLAAYDEVLGLIADGLRANDIRGLLRCEPLQPLFKVR